MKPKFKNIKYILVYHTNTVLTNCVIYILDKKKRLEVNYIQLNIRNNNCMIGNNHKRL